MTTANSMTTPWSSETNWTVSRGSLDSVVTFESFDFPIDTESTCRKPPLLLVPPSSSDFEPCEIKLNFTQKHEIRQVYIRSTARVYEIYYAPALQSDSEYLCTVRCSAASVEDNVVPATDVKEVSSVNTVGPSDILPKARVGGENKIGTNEDDWVEVKLPGGHMDEGNVHLTKQNSNNSRNYQDYYEATAEINDSEPCMSLTLRLLSLQSKGCVFVDEVYVFADLIHTNDSQNHTVNTETSAGSSLMTMLVPTLLGLTKSRSLQLHNHNSSNPVGKPFETELEPATSANPVNLIHQQDETLLKPSEVKAELTRSQLHVSTPGKDTLCDSPTRNDFSHSRVEILLEQLVSRVSRIEDICMRFEENMLKPINNMEARLQHVEQQVELLGKNNRFPVSPSFSSFEPNGGPRSLTNDGNDSLLSGEPESEKTGSFSNETHKPPEDDEKEEVNDVLESPKKEKPKKTVSIDDALAAALAGFSSFTKTNDSFTALPLESPKEECLKSNQASIDTTLGSYSDDEENDEATTSCGVSTEILDDGISQVGDEEAMGSTANFSCPSSSPQETEAQLVKQGSTKAVKILTFDKTDILKYFPYQPPDTSESRVDFESPILEVKFASFENGGLESPLAALLSCTDDAATDESVLIEEKTKIANNLLVDLDGDDVSEGVQQDLPSVQLETSFASLI